MAFTPTVSPSGAGRAWISDTRNRTSETHWEISYQVQAEANLGYKFDHWEWQITEHYYSTSNPISGTGRTNPYPTNITSGSTIYEDEWRNTEGEIWAWTEVNSVVAVFSEGEKYTVTTTPSSSEAGTTSPTSQAYTEGEECTATANVLDATICRFSQWEKLGTGISTENPYTFEVNQDTDLLGRYQWKWTIKFSPEEGSSEKGGDRWFDDQKEAAINAKEAEGYSFLRWEKDGKKISDTEYYSATANKSSVGTYTAFFEEGINITTTPKPTEGGTTEGDGNYKLGEDCTLTAIANEGYEFQAWVHNGKTVTKDDAAYSFKVKKTDAGEWTAIFRKENKWYIYTDHTPQDGGTESGAGEYDDGDQCTLQAFPNVDENYHFVMWKMDGNIQSYQASYSFKVTKSTAGTYTAVYSNEDPGPTPPGTKYVIKVCAEPAKYGIVAGGGSYDPNATCTITAKDSQSKYEFQYWETDGVQVSTEREYEFEVTKDATYVAHFKELTGVNLYYAENI